MSTWTAQAHVPEPTVAQVDANRDWVIMPLIAFFTVLSIVGPTEWMARRLFGQTKTNMLDCLVVDDPQTGVRGIPNCVCRQKVYEERSATEYRLNSRGHRAGVELQPKAPGTFRIVMVGSSIAEGMRVARTDTIAALLPTVLSRAEGRRVELYNEGMMYGTPHRVDLAFADALAAQPDMILWLLTPWDLANASVAAAPWAKAHVGLFGNPGEGGEAVDKGTHSAQLLPFSQGLSELWSFIVKTLDRSRTVIMLRHYLYESQTLYVRSYLKQAEGGQFLSSKLGSSARSHLEQFAAYTADITRKAASAGIPLLVTLVPHGAQATMIAMGTWPAGFDPYSIGERVRDIVERQGATYVDILGSFRQVPEPQRLFMAVDGHPTADGHAVLTQILATRLEPEIRAEEHAHSLALLRSRPDLQARR